MPLIEERRTQLDGIVNQMIQNKESEDDIQWVVNDFKSKYEENVPIQVETPVGGTYVPKMFPVGGGKAPGISTITGKPEMEYHPGKQPEASFTTMMKAGLADDPFIKMKIFSVDRGIPIERYRLNPKDQVEFKDNEGNWQREVGEATESKIKNVAATVTGDPRAILGTAGGMIAGIPGMVGGTVLGAVARKAGATLVFGERRKYWDDLVDVGIDTGLALTIGGASKVLKFGIDKYILGKGAGALKKVAPMLEPGTRKMAETSILSLEDQAKAAYIQNLSDKMGFKLLPHQLYEKQSLTDLWMYLRHNPTTADAVQAMDKEIISSNEKALTSFIKRMGGYEKTSYEMGKEAVAVSHKRFETLEAGRAKKVGPMYEKALEKAGPIDLEPAIDKLDDLISGTPDGPSKSALLRVKKSLTVEAPPEPKAGGVEAGGKARISETDLSKIQKALFELNDLIEGTSHEAQQISPSSKNVLNRELMQVKKEILSIVGKESPEFIKANAKFERLSTPIDKLKKTIIGELAGVRKETEIPTRWHKLVNAPDEVLLREAKTQIGKENPELWRKIVGTYMRDVYSDVTAAQGGEVINPMGKMYKALFGTEKKKAIMRAAFEGLPEGQAIEDLMTVMQRASVGYSGQSMTWNFAQIDDLLSGGKLGLGMARLATMPKATITKWTSEKWAEGLTRANQEEIFKALSSPEALETLSKLKRLPPGSRKLIDGLAYFTATSLGKYYKETP